MMAGICGSRGGLKSSAPVRQQGAVHWHTSNRCLCYYAVPHASVCPWKDSIFLDINDIYVSLKHVTKRYASGTVKFFWRPMGLLPAGLNDTGVCLCGGQGPGLVVSYKVIIKVIVMMTRGDWVSFKVTYDDLQPQRIHAHCVPGMHRV